MIRILDFEYGFMGEADCRLQLDTEKFTKESAQDYLDFFSWDFDKDADPVEEYMKKVAMQCIKECTFNGLSLEGVISIFEEAEGWPYIDGSVGITLLDVTPYEFDESDLEMKEKAPKQN